MSTIERRIERLEKQVGIDEKPPRLLIIDCGDEVVEIYEDELDQLLQEIDGATKGLPSEQELIKAQAFYMNRQARGQRKATSQNETIQ